MTLSRLRDAVMVEADERTEAEREADAARAAEAALPKAETVKTIRIRLTWNCRVKTLRMNLYERLMDGIRAASTADLIELLPDAPVSPVNAALLAACEAVQADNDLQMHGRAASGSQEHWRTLRAAIAAARA